MILQVMNNLMKSNYNFNNWVELGVFFLVYITIIGVPVTLYVEYVFVPILNGHIEFLDFINDDGLIERYRDVILDKIDNNDIETDEFTYALITMLAFVLGPIALILWGLFAMINFLLSSSWYVCRKLNLIPMLQLVIIRNGKATTVLRFKQ